MCVCVCVCMRACVRARVCVCVCVCAYVHMCVLACRLECDASCALLERNRRLALALEIQNPELDAKLSGPKFSDFLKESARWVVLGHHHTASCMLS